MLFPFSMSQRIGGKVRQTGQLAGRNRPSRSPHLEERPVANPPAKLNTHCPAQATRTEGSILEELPGISLAERLTGNLPLLRGPRKALRLVLLLEVLELSEVRVADAEQVPEYAEIQTLQVDLEALLQIERLVLQVRKVVGLLVLQPGDPVCPKNETPGGGTGVPPP